MHVFMGANDSSRILTVTPSEKVPANDHRKCRESPNFLGKSEDFRRMTVEVKV